MITSDSVIVPESPEQAYRLYKNEPSAVLLAGSQGLKYRKEHYDVAIDLSKVGLQGVEDSGDEISIGALTKLSAVAKSPLVKALAGGAISQCINDIQDKMVLQAGTIGGVIAAKEPFSVLLPILLSLHVDVELQDKGRMDLQDYLSCPPMREMIRSINIAKEVVFTAYKACRALPTDEPYLIGAVSCSEDAWVVTVGGRPGMAAIAENASAELTEKGLSVRENVAHLASEELEFGNFGPCSEAERRKLTLEMMRDLIKKAWKGHSRQLEGK